MNRSHLTLLTLPLLAACGSLDDSRFATGSSTLAAGTDFTTLHVVDADSGVVGSMDADGNEIGRLELGGEPTRIARLGDKYLVSQRTERSLAVLTQGDDGLTLDSRIPVGAEPVGVVAAEDGSFAYVAASLSGTVVEIDGSTMELSRSWAIPGEPRWVALHPSENALFVGSAYGSQFHRIDLGTDEVTAFEFPEVRAQAFSDGSEFAMTPRMTGDLAISPNGKAIAMPVLYVDNTTPVPPAGGVFDDVGGGGGYASNGGTRFTGTVVLMDVDTSGGIVEADPAVISLNGFVNNGEFATVGGYAASLTWATGNEHVFAAMEGAGAVLRVQLYQRERFTNGGSEPGLAVPEPMPMDDMGDFGEDFFTTGAFVLADQIQFHDVDTVATGAGPRGVASLDWDQVFVHSFMDRSVAKLPVDALPVRNEFGETEEETMPGGGMTTDVFFDEEGGGNAFTAAGGTVLAPDVLSADVRAGRELFYSSVDSRMSSSAAPISCGTCHADGRTDGVTWTFLTDSGDTVQLQTPSLAGDVSATAPVTWLSDVATVADEAMLTSQGRMGGNGLGTSDAELVAAYIDWSRAPDAPLAGVDSEAVRRGQALFNSDSTQCSDCHSGDALTDNDTYDMYGLQGVRTRSLVGIAASAPYLHDGSAPTLKGLMERSRDGSMGDTSSLSDAQVDDLVSYLMSL